MAMSRKRRTERKVCFLCGNNGKDASMCVGCTCFRGRSQERRVISSLIGLIPSNRSGRKKNAERTTENRMTLMINEGEFKDLLSCFGFSSVALSY